MDKDEAKKLFAGEIPKSIFKDLKGVKYKVDYKDKKAIEHLDIDYTEVDMKKLNKRLGVSTKENKDISFEKLEKAIKAQRFKRKR